MCQLGHHNIQSLHRKSGIGDCDHKFLCSTKFKTLSTVIVTTFTAFGNEMMLEFTD